MAVSISGKSDARTPRTPNDIFNDYIRLAKERQMILNNWPHSDIYESPEQTLAREVADELHWKNFHSLVDLLVEAHCIDDKKLTSKIMTHKLKGEKLTIFGDVFLRYKEDVANLIIDMPDNKMKKQVIGNILNKKGLLGHLFWVKRGFFAPRLGAGQLKKLVEEFSKLSSEKASASPLDAPLSGKGFFSHDGKGERKGDEGVELETIRRPSGKEPKGP